MPFFLGAISLKFEVIVEQVEVQINKMKTN